MRKRCLACTVGFMFIVCFAGAFAGEGKNPSAAELLEKYAESLDASLSFIAHYEGTVKYSYRTVLGQCRGTQHARGHEGLGKQGVYRMDYKWGDYNPTYMDLPEDKPYYHCLINNHEMFYQNCTWVNVENHIGSAHRRPKPKDVGLTLARAAGSGYLLGYIRTDERLDKVLGNATKISVRNIREKVGESKCYVIDADTKHGRYSVWIDPKHGFLPAKVRRYAKEGDAYYSRPLLKRETAKFYVRNVRFEEFDGVWVIMEAEMGMDLRQQKGYFQKEDRRFKRTKFVLNPDHEGLGSFVDPILEDASNDPELKEGDSVRLTMPGYESVKFKWQGKDHIPEFKKVSDERNESGK